MFYKKFEFIVLILFLCVAFTWSSVQGKDQHKSSAPDGQNIKISLTLNPINPVTDSSIPIRWDAKDLDSPGFEIGYGFSRNRIGNWSYTGAINSAIVANLKSNTDCFFQIRAKQKKGMVYSEILMAKTASGARSSESL